MILAAIAAAAGIARALSGINSAKAQKKRDKYVINEGYTRSKQQMLLDETNIRQGTNESLNARGVLNGGAGSAPGDKIRQALSYTTPAPAKGFSFGRQDKLNLEKAKAAAGGNNQDNKDVAQAATRTANTGAMGTLSGQVNSDLTDQFYREGDDLLRQRNLALDDAKNAAKSSIFGALGAGVDTGMSVYGMGKQLGSMGSHPTTPAPTSAPAPSSQSSPLSTRGWGGYDVINPIGTTYQPLTNSEFHVNKSGDQ